MLILKCLLTSVFRTVVIPLEVPALQSSWKKISISPCQDKKETYVKNTRKRHHRGFQFSPPNFTWQVVTGETRIHSQLAHSPLCIHREQLVTERQSFCKTWELYLDSVMNVKFQVTEKSINPREQPSKHVMKWVKVRLPSKPIVLAVLIPRRNLV